MATTLFTQNIIACIWDFDKTLIPEYMQSPLFRRYGVNEPNFWNETNNLVSHYRKRGYQLSGEIAYLNHILTHVLAGQMAGLNNRILRECGADIQFYPGMPSFFDRSRTFVREKPEHIKHEISLEHYVVSIGMVIDNTTKTKAIFEINKGTNKNPSIDVNSNIRPEDRRIPLQNMIYIADGPSDIPSFSVVKSGGGSAYAVYNPDSTAEFEQNDRLRQAGRIDHYGPADYSEKSQTSRWLRLQIHKICDRIVADRESAVAQRVSRPPRHLSTSPEEEAALLAARKAPRQTSFIDETK